MPDNIETEIKLYVPHLEMVQIRLERIGAKLTAERVYERNVRYENAEKTLTEQGIVVRLRQDSRARLTYKGRADRNDSGITSRLEAEVEVSDFGAMETILGKLGYTPYMGYEKYRTTYTANNAEIVLDELPYGNFIEIEGEAAAIQSLIKQLDLSDAPQYDGSYTTLFERVKKHLGLTFNDLTFENFKGVNVPESAFDAQGDEPSKEL
jgi:adenylate cyclase class 2